MKVPLLISGFIVSAFLTLSATSQAAPRGGFRGVNFRSGRNFTFNTKTAVSFVAAAVFFFNSPSGLFTGTLTAILTITPIWITGRITIFNTRTIRQRLCNRKHPDPPSAVTRLLSSSIQATLGPSIRAPILRTSLASTVQPR